MSMTPDKTEIDHLRRRLVEVFLKYTEAIPVRIVHPYIVKCEPEKPQKFPVILLDFGSPSGAVVDVIEARESADFAERTRVAEKCGLWCSYVNVEALEELGINGFLEMLDDWNFRGLNIRGK